MGLLSLLASILCMILCKVAIKHKAYDEVPICFGFFVINVIAFVKYTW